jgi:hypothetical protein
MTSKRRIDGLRDEIMSQWETDCEIDESHLDTASLHSAKLHFKYMTHFSNVDRYLRQLYGKRRELDKELYEYYTGKSQKPFPLKILKADVPKYLAADERWNELINEIGRAENLKETLAMILDEIKSRQWRIKNAIEWKKFIDGG